MTPWIVAALALLLCVALLSLLMAQRSEILYLRRLLEQRRDHEQRVERVEAGLPELPVKEREPDRPPPGVAAEIEELLGAWENPATAEGFRKDIVGWRADGQDWPWILDRLRDEVLG